MALARVDVEQRDELLLPLAEERLRRDEEHARGALGEHLGHDEAGLDRLPEADLVGEDAPALADATEREDHGFDLVRVGVDPRRALRRGVAAVLVGAPQAHEVLRQVAALRGVQAARRPSRRRGASVSHSYPSSLPPFIPPATLECDSLQQHQSSKTASRHKRPEEPGATCRKGTSVRRRAITNEVERSPGGLGSERDQERRREPHRRKRPSTHAGVDATDRVAGRRRGACEHPAGCESASRGRWRPMVRWAILGRLRSDSGALWKRR